MAAGEGCGLLSGVWRSLTRWDVCVVVVKVTQHKACEGGKLLMTWCCPAAPDACWESGGRSPEVKGSSRGTGKFWGTSTLVKSAATTNGNTLITQPSSQQAKADSER